MPSTDDRVVAMHFDNVAFEKRVADTIASMDKLKKSLDVSAATKGLGDLKSAGHNFDLSGMSSAIENISHKFSAMGAVAFSVINTIVSQATTAGIQLGKALSLDQTIGGFREYETNMNSIQTILANTRADGTNLEQVSAALEELNLYSDKTIYNFSQMARNIGTFTAAGVSLETSTGAIKGIANLAAVSGSNAEQASTAMYQLSQALASGSVKLMDWNSVVNAGMGGEVFQKALWETGKALGTIKDIPMDQTFEQWKDAGNTFRATLEQGWVTADVLTNTLAGFTGDLTEAQVLSMGYTKEQAAEILAMGIVAQDAATKVKTFTQLIGTIKESIGSGWAQTFKIIFGDFEEARTLFTGFSEFFGGLVKKSSEARNKMLASWEKLGGRDVLIQSLMYAVKGLTDLLTPLKEAFRDIFPKKTGMALYTMTVHMRNFLRSILPTEETMEKLKRIFTGFFSAVDIGIEVIKGIWGIFKALFNTLAGASDGKILEFFAQIGDKITQLRETLVKGKGIQHFFEDITPKIVGFATTFVEKFKEIISIGKEVTGFFKNGLGGVDTKSAEGIEAVANKIGLAAGKVKEFIADFIENFENLDNYFRRGMDWGALVGDGPAVALAGNLGKAFQEVKTFVLDAMTAIGNFKDKVVELSSSISESAQGLFKRIFGDDADGDVKKIEGMADKMSAAGDKLREFKDKVAEIGKGGTGKSPAEIFKELGDSGQTLGDRFSGIADTLQGVWDRITSGIGGLKGQLEEFISFIQGFVGESGESTSAAAGGAAKKGMAKATDSVGKVSKGDGIDTSDIVAGGALGAIILIFRDLRKLIPDISGLFKNINKGIREATDSIKEVTGVLEAMQLKLKAEALQSIGKAIALITASMVVLSLMDTAALVGAATAVGVVVGQLVGAMALLSKFASGPAATAKIGVMAAAMIGMAAGVLTMSIAAKIMATINIEDLIKGIAAITILMGALALSAGKLQKLDLKGGGGLILFAYGLKNIADAVLIFGNMDLSELAQGMAALVVSLFLLADFTDHLPNGADLIRAGAGIAVIAFGLNLMATAAKIFATMGWEEMAKGLIGVAASLGMMVGALKLLPTDIKVLAAAAALLVMSFALQMLATTLGVIAALSSDDMTKALIGLGIALGILAGAAYLMQSTVLGSAAIALISVSLSGLAEALAMFADISWGDLLGGLAKLAVALGGIALVAYLLAPAVLAIGALGLALIALGAGFALMGAGAYLVGEGFKAIAEAGGAALPVFMDFLKGIISLIPEFIGAVADGLLLLGQKILDAAPGLIDGFGKTLGAFLDMLVELIPKAAKLMSELFTELINVAKEVTPEAIEAGFGFLMSFLRGIRDNIGEIVEVVVDIVTGFIDALALKLPQIIDSAYNFIVALVKGVIAKLGDIGLQFLPLGLDMIQGIWDGIWSGISWFGEKIGEFFTWCIDTFKSWFGIHSPSTAMAEIGVDILKGLWEGISSVVSWLLEQIGGLITSVLDLFTGAITWLLQAGKDILQGLWDGMIAVYTQVGEWLLTMPTLIGDFFLNALTWLLDAGKRILQGMWDGITAVWKLLTNWIGTFPTLLADLFVGALTWLLDAGRNIIRGLREGAETVWELFKNWVTSFPEKILGWLGKTILWLFDKGWDIIKGLWDGAWEVWLDVQQWVLGMKDKVLGWIKKPLEWLYNVGYDIIMGLWKGIKAAWDWMWDQVTSLFGLLKDEVEGSMEVKSPSRWSMWIGEMIGQGLVIGINKMERPVAKSAAALAESMIGGFGTQSLMTSLTDQLSGMEEFNPTITPVLDLTNVEKNAARLSGMFGSGTTMTANITAAQTAALAANTSDTETSATTVTAPAPFQFTQINNSPEALSTSDIYRNTRNQLTMAKEALAIP